MSRYKIFDDKNKRVMVGWDDPMTSFFAQVTDIEKDEPLLLNGNLPNEIQTIEGLQETIKEYPIPSNVIGLLKKDKENTKPLSQLQELAREFIEKRNKNEKNL